ncbi:methyltransferase family protein, partial [Scheffersomyces coipomensis]|uniref:methyltransferase family protein n=1 Tax=Scheffersomyces coipomensis TaxID=1788519 RepID=UPI00315D433F
PLQPLRDDLDISIYEQFEQDFIKYNQYEKAIELSILDLIATNKFNSTAIKIIIIGPGKGGILHKLINVVNKFSHQTFKIYAFEKNIKCIPYLHKYNQQNWNNQLEIIQDDIRNQNITNVNLIISELLGSFGDNELCPEILQQFNKPQTYPMIMIPSSYTSYLQPVSTDLTIPEFERPYIVKLTKYISLSPFKPVFDWDYPDPSLSSLDKVTTALNFKVENGLLDVVTITGFYGYFTADLYGHLTIQIINDEDRDTYCKSWYPFYFPIDPEDIDNGTSVEFNICRINNGVDKVWYEWEFNDKVYNKNGNHYYIEF